MSEWAEQSVLSYLINNPSEVPRIQELAPPEYFRPGFNRTLYRCIQGLYPTTNGKPIAVASIIEYDKTHGSKEARLAIDGVTNIASEYTSAGSIDQTLLTIIRDHKRRATKSLLKSALKNIDDSPVEESLQHLLGSLEGIQETATPRDEKTPALTAMSAGDLLTEEIERPESLLGDGIIPVPYFSMLSGPPGAGKSWLALQLATSIASATPFLNIPTQSAKVGVVMLELPPFFLKSRIQTLNRALGNEVLQNRMHQNLVLVSRRWLSRPVDLMNRPDELIDLITRFELKLLILDPLSRSHTEDENSNQDMGILCSRIEEICISTGCSVLVIHHDSKNSSEKAGIHASRGSSRFASDPNTIIHVAKIGDSHVRRLSFEKCNFGPEPAAIHITHNEHGEFYPTDPPQAKARDAKEERIELITLYIQRAGARGISTEELIEESGFDCSDRTMRTYAKQAGATYANKKWVLMG